jgi:lipoprotein-releasing system permease protein
MTIHLISFASLLHKQATLRSSHEAILSELEKYYTVKLVDYQDMDKLTSDDFKIIFIATGGVERLVIQHFERLPRPAILLVDGMQNSLAAALEISTWLRGRGMKSEILHGELPAIIQRVHILYNNFRAQRSLFGKRIGVIGFKSEVRNKVIGFGSHIQITNLDAVNSYETHPIVAGDSLIAALSDYPEVSHVQRYSTKPGMIKTDDAFQGMVLKGVGPEFDSRFMKEYLVEGEIPVFSDSVSSNQVLISKALATKMKLKLGDKIYTYYIQDEVRARRLTIAGIYQTNFSEYDNLFLLTDLNLVNRLNGWQREQVSGVELQVRDYDKLEDVTYEIAIDTDSQRDKFGGIYYVRNIEQLNPQIFEWLGLLDMNVWVILFLMIGVAGFTMISGLLIIIIERTNMIGILKALGADNFTIRKTFLWFSVFLIGKECFGET